MLCSCASELPPDPGADPGAKGPALKTSPALLLCWGVEAKRLLRPAQLAGVSKVLMSMSRVSPPGAPWGPPK